MLLRALGHTGLLTLGFVAWIADPASGQLDSPGASGSESSLHSSGVSKSDEKAAIGKYRFEPQPNREYLIQRARQESDARRNLLQYYQAMGWNYAQPTVDGMTLHPYPRSRRPFSVKPIRPW